jgi:hypothetical protein
MKRKGVDLIAMSSEEIKPDAYSFERYFKMKTDSETNYATKHPDEWIDEVEVNISIVPESIDPLYSAETIKQLWKDEFKKSILGEADILRERGETDVAAQLEHLANRFVEVFSSNEQ